MTATDLYEFETAFGGEIVQPEDALYDELRKVFNAMVDRRPALFARCSYDDRRRRPPSTTRARRASPLPSTAAATASPVTPSATTAW